MTTRLRQFIEAESDAMVSTLRYYLYRAGVAPASLASAAHELWNDVVVEALRTEQRIPENAQPRAWLLGIAANLIKRRRSELVRRERREPLVRDLHSDDGLSDDELFDWLAELSAAPQAIRVDEPISMLLLDLSLDDQRIIKLGIVYGLSGEALARELETTPGAARVRLHRALERLRKAYLAERADS